MNATQQGGRVAPSAQKVCARMTLSRDGMAVRGIQLSEMREGMAVRSALRVFVPVQQKREDDWRKLLSALNSDVMGRIQ